MRYTNSTDAQTLRRKAVGPAALMTRRQLSAYVPERGQTRARMPLRGFGGATVTDAAEGASIGAKVGSVVPVLGTAVGAILGGLGGAIASAFGRQDAEAQNFNQAEAIAQQGGPSAVLNIGNKYLVLAGLFDLQPSQIKGNIPIYKKYGRMGENAFVHAMCNLIYSAAQSGQITANDTVQTIFSRIVQPWINSFGFGAMSDSNADMINYILLGMIAEYIAGLQSRWFSTGGQNTFGDLPQFALAAAPAATATVPAAAASSVPAELQSYMNGATPESGAAINYARDVNGKFVAIPAGGTYGGIDPATRAWIVHFASGSFISNNATLTPYGTAAASTGPAATNTAPAPVSPVMTPQQLAPTSQSQSFAPASTGAYIAPQVSAPVYSAPSLTSGISTTDMLLIGAGVVGLVLILKAKGQAAK